MNKRSIVLLFTFVSMFASYFAFAVLPVSADASTEQCWDSSFVFQNETLNPGTVTVELHDSSPQTHFYQATFILQPGETQTVSVHGLFPMSANSFSSTATSLTLTFVSFGNFGRVNFDLCAGVGHIDDGRINAYDLGAPLAAYCTSDKGIAVWDIDDSGHGTLAFTSTKADIAKALSDAQSSGQNVLVGEGLGDSLYALSTNQLTLVGPDLNEPGKNYEFVTTGDRCG